MASSLEIGFALDRRWHWLRSEMERSKKPALLQLGRIFEESRLPYAIIGGVALQIHQRDPRTTLDIDLAVLAREAIPRSRLREAGFRETGTFSHSENWIGPEDTPVQFTDDPALAQPVQRAEIIQLEGTPLRVIGKLDLLREKLRAGTDSARRRSKRLQDLADAHSLVEATPELLTELSEEERALLA